MPFVPNRIMLIARGRYDEAPAGANIYPGMAGMLNAAGNIVPHNVAGGRDFKIVLEQALLGGNKNTVIPSGTVVPFYHPAKGDKFLMLLRNLSNAARGDYLMSAGDGTLIAAVGEELYNITAPSTAITNTPTETTFSNGTYTVPANYFQASDILRIRGRATVTGQNSADTHRLKVYIGSTVLMDTAAVSLAAGNVEDFDLYMTVRTIGVTGTIVSSGQFASGPIGTGATKTYDLASTVLDTTAAAIITVKSTCSGTSPTNTVILDDLQITIDRGGGVNQLVQADEAVDNTLSTGTSDFNTAKHVRVLVI